MTQYSSFTGYRVATNGSLQFAWVNVYYNVPSYNGGGSGVVRPVINVYKSSLENDSTE